MRGAAAERIRMELATPITIHWDLPPADPDTDFLLKVCTDIVECRPLVLHVHVPDPFPLDGIAAVLERLRGAPIAVSLTISPALLASAEFARLSASGVKEILVTADRVAVLERMASRPVPGVSFPVRRDNWRELPALVALCASRGIDRLILPMQRLYNGETPFYLTREEQSALAAEVAGVGGVQGLNLTIHDPFLWRAFHPGVPFPQGGCQAANTMIAIAPDGGVYPCPTLPVRLGMVGETSLKAIVASSAKKELRRRLLAPPEACRACGELDDCRGGCRGRGYRLHDSLDEVDVACR